MWAKEELNDSDLSLLIWDLDIAILVSALAVTDPRWFARDEMQSAPRVRRSSSTVHHKKSDGGAAVNKARR